VSLKKEKDREKIADAEREREEIAST